jgi:LPS sulfotransferase NodH
MAASNKICILGSPRTGSTLLRQLLDSQQGVVFAGEVFHPKNVQVHPKLRARLPEAERTLVVRDADPVGFLEKLAAVCPEPTFGLKVFPSHADAVREHVIGSPDWRIVILYRANFLAVHASRLAARATGAFAAGKTPDGGKPKVLFEADKFAQDWKVYDRYYDKLVRKCVAAGKPFHLVEYREVQRPEIVRNLARHLGFPHETPFKTGLVKEGSNDILSRFSNAEAAAEGIARIGRADWAREQGPLFLQEGAQAKMAAGAKAAGARQGAGGKQGGGKAGKGKLKGKKGRKAAEAGVAGEAA